MRYLGAIILQKFRLMFKKNHIIITALLGTIVAWNNSRNVGLGAITDRGEMAGLEPLPQPKPLSQSGRSDKCCCSVPEQNNGDIRLSSLVTMLIASYTNSTIYY